VGENYYIRVFIYVMPYVTRRRRSYSRKRPVRKTRGLKGRRTYRRKFNRKVGVQRSKWLSPIRANSRLKFVYSDSQFSSELDVLTGMTSIYVFRANSPYEPNLTGVGVQPYGWDENMSSSMFSEYNCYSSSIKVYVGWLDSSQPVRRLHCIVFPWGASNPTVSDISDIRMIPGRREIVYDYSNETTKGAQISNYSSTRRMFSNVSPNDQDYGAAYNASPSKLWYWVIMFYSQSTSTIDVYFDVKIKYYTKVTRATSKPNES